MRGIRWRIVLDRALIAAAILTGLLGANQMAPVAPPAPAQVKYALACTHSDGPRRQLPKDLFVPTAPLEPVESLEN